MDVGDDKPEGKVENQQQIWSTEMGKEPAATTDKELGQPQARTASTTMATRTSRQPLGSPSRWRSYRSMVTVEPANFCYMFGSYLSYTAFLSLAYDKSCLRLYNSTFCDALENKTFSDEHEDEADAVQSASSFWLLVANIVTAVPAIFSVFFFMGPWGDKVDRKLPLLIPCAGALVYNLLNLLSAYFQSWSIFALFPGLAMDALSGSYLTILMASYSYVTHITSLADRTVRVAIVGSMTYIAATISVFVSGLLVDTVGHVTVFAIVCGFNGVALIYGIVFLESVIPEDKVKDDATDQSWLDKFVFSTVRETWTFVKKPREGNIRLLMWLEILTLNIVHLVTSGEGDILYLYLKRSPRSFTSTQYGYFKGAENFSRSIMLLTLLPLLKKKLGVRDSTIVLIGLVFRGVTLAVLGVAENLLVVFLAAIPALFQGFPSAGLRSSMAGRVQSNEHGRLFAVVAALESCVSMAAGFIFNGWYPSTLDYFDGTCFMFAAGMCVVAVGIELYIHVHSKPSSNKISDSSSADVQVASSREEKGSHGIEEQLSLTAMPT